jgi:hypothetical protein
VAATNSKSVNSASGGQYRNSVFGGIFALLNGVQEIAGSNPVASIRYDFRLFPPWPAFRAYGRGVRQFKTSDEPHEGMFVKNFL